MIGASAIVDNVHRFESELDTVLQRLGCARSEIEVVAVSKTFPAECIAAAATAGLTQFGENRVQEAKSKIPLLDPAKDLKWHLIGHLQTNKSRDAVSLFDVIQSVDRWDLAETLNHRAGLEGKRQDIFIQVNTTQESQKSGCDPDQLDDFLAKIVTLKNLHIQGLMTIGPFVDDPGPIRRAFALLRGEFDRYSKQDLGGGAMRWCSMGMSGDWPIALEEGANMLRIGSAIFGERNLH